MKEENLPLIARQKAKTGRIELSKHAADEAFDETITIKDIHEALSHREKTRVLEFYPSDPRGPSCLFVGPAKDGRWIHVVAGGFDRERLIIITVYRPKPPKWRDPFTRGG
jgi:hypothetical protein